MINLQSKGLDIQKLTNKATRADFPLPNKNAAVSVLCTPVRGKKEDSKKRVGFNLNWKWLRAAQLLKFA